MAKHLCAGELNQNGPCTLFTDVNANGLNMYDCDEFTYTPAACPDDSGEGTINAGTATAKIASVDGTVPDVCVQRDAAGDAFANDFRVTDGGCALADQGTWIGARVVAVGNVTWPADISKIPELRLRGVGDYVSTGGLGPDNAVGVGVIQRTATLTGRMRYANHGFPIANLDGHLFTLESPAEVASQNLMYLQSTGGTLYFPAWTYVSDVRLKNDVKELDGRDALAVVLGISPISYSMRDKIYHGFSAQNVKTVLPDAVTETPEGPMTMRDGDILANLLAAVKYLTARVEALEAKCGG